MEQNEDKIVSENDLEGVSGGYSIGTDLGMTAGGVATGVAVGVLGRKLFARRTAGAEKQVLHDSAGANEHAVALHRVPRV